MTIDTTISLGNLITLGVLLFGAISAVLTLRFTVRSNNAAIKGLSDALTALSGAHDTTAKRVEEVRSTTAHELADMRVDLAKNYVNAGQLDGLEKRFAEGMSRLEVRFDRVDNRLNKIHGE